MGLIQDQPEDLPTTNALDGIEDPDAQPAGERAEIYLSGAQVATLDNAPTGAGSRVTLMVELEVVEEGHRYRENGETEVPVRRCKRVGDMWVPGTERPPTREEIKVQQEAAKAKAAAEQAEREEREREEQERNEPPMFDEDGNAISDDAPRPPEDDESGRSDNGISEISGEPYDDEDQGDDNVVQFSDGGK